jgi:stearoyl-CoA desaturase (Delta-9 desaturase)
MAAVAGASLGGISAGIDPVEHPRADAAATAVVTVAPALGLGWAAWEAWGGLLTWQDLVVFAITYVLAGLGITVGFHRLLTHRSFRTSAAVRGVLAALGSSAVEGPVIEWVSQHRMHHAYSDRAGDPHSPHVGHSSGWRGALTGLLHAHLGWLFRMGGVASPERYAPDLLTDATIRFVDRTFLLWVLAGLAVPFGLGVALTGSVVGGLTGLLWGGAVRMFCLHHATFSINSLCHFFGRQPFRTDDESRNLAWLALPTLGEAWHNNHHAFPTSASHGMRRWQLDPSAAVIWALERCGLAWEVVRIPEAISAARAAPRTPSRQESPSSRVEQHKRLPVEPGQLDHRPEKVAR